MFRQIFFLVTLCSGCDVRNVIQRSRNLKDEISYMFYIGYKVAEDDNKDCVYASAFMNWMAVGVLYL